MRDFYKGFTVLYPRSTLIIISFFVQLDYWRRCTNMMEHPVGQFVASGLTGLFAYWLIWPLEVLKNVTQAEAQNVGTTFKERYRYIYSKYGIKGFYRGIIPGSQGIFIRTGASLSIMLLF